MGLGDAQVLRRAAGVRVVIGGAHRVSAALGDAVVECGRHGLAVLDAFAEPATVAGAMASLRGRSAGMQDWLNLLGTIQALHRAGVLEDPERASAEAPEPGAVDAPLHAMLLEDRVRTSAFMKAVGAVVRPGDVVVDIGTGTGILAMAAARAGARRVYAIEAGRIADAAQALFDANGLADRITLVRGWSAGVSLPERAHVLVSETIGTEPLGERVLEEVRDARRRMLRRGARLIPRRIALRALPLEVPERRTRGATFTERSVRRWTRWYGVDLRPLARAAQPAPWVLQTSAAQVRRWRRLAEPLDLAEVDLGRVRSLELKAQVAARAAREGVLSGLAVYFELDLAPGVGLSNGPRSPETHWGVSVWVLPRPIPLRTGERFQVRYRYGGGHAELSCRALADAP